MDKRQLNCHFKIYIMSVSQQPVSSGRSLLQGEFGANASKIEEKLEVVSQASQANADLIGCINYSARDHLEECQTKRGVQKLSFSKQKKAAEQIIDAGQLMYHSHLIPEGGQEKSWECIRRIKQYNIQQNELERHQRKREQDRKAFICRISQCIDALRQTKPRTQEIHRQLANKYKQLVRELYAGFQFWQQKCLSRQKSSITKFKQLKSALQAQNRQKIHYLNQYNEILQQNQALHEELRLMTLQKEKLTFEMEKLASQTEKLRSERQTVEEKYDILMQQTEKNNEILLKVQETIKRVDEIEIQHHDQIEKCQKIKQQMLKIMKSFKRHRVLIKQKDIEMILLKRRKGKQQENEEGSL